MKVTSNTAISLDGRINTRERRFVFFGSAEDHRRMSRLRAEADAVLVGGATFRNWPHASLPDPVDRGALRARPWNVVVTRSLDVPLGANFLAEPAIRPLFLTRADSLRDGFAAEAEGWGGAGPDLPIAWILEQLERRGVERLLVEAGGDLLFQFLAAGALDEMHVTLCPLLAGGDAPALVEGAGFDVADLRRLHLLGAETVDDEVFLRYRVRPADGATRT
jgi:riboflavin-specific deaminase-like protein